MGDVVSMSKVVDVIPPFSVFGRNTTVVENVDMPPNYDNCVLPTTYVGLIGRLSQTLTYDGKRLCIVGPEGSGRKSFAIAIAELNNKKHRLVSYTEFHDKYVGETESKINKTLAKNRSEGYISIFTDIPHAHGDGVLTSIVQNVLRKLETTKDVWVIDTECRLQSFQRIDLSFGSPEQLMDWAIYYFQDPTIGLELSRLRILPSHMAGIPKHYSRSQILETIYSKLLSNELVKREGELTIDDWEPLLDSKLSQMRKCVRQSIWDGRNAPGYLFHGAPGSGKTHAYHTLVSGTRVRRGESVESMEEAKKLYRVYGNKAPLYIVLLDEFERLVSETHPESMRHRILAIFGTERDTPPNLKVIATTNTGLDRISPAVWRSQRLVPIEMTFVTPEEMEQYAPGIPFMDKIQFVSIIELSKVPHEERVAKFLTSLDLPIPSRVLTDDDVRRMIPESFVDKAIKLREKTREGCDRVYVVDVRQKGLLKDCFDVVREGLDCINRLRVYRLLDIKPLCLVIIKQEEIPLVDYIPPCCCIIAVEVMVDRL